jgi:hypothetical protein
MNHTELFEEIVNKKYDKSIITKLIGMILQLDNSSKSVSDKSSILSSAISLYGIDPDLASRVVRVIDVHVNENLKIVDRVNALYLKSKLKGKV